MTYKKPLKGFNATTLMGFPVDAMDEANKREGSYAIEAFEGRKTIKGKAEDAEVLVPFHAVKTAMYGTFTEDAEKADPYCGGGGTDTVTVTFVGCYGVTPETDSITVNKGESIILPNSGFIRWTATDCNTEWSEDAPAGWGGDEYTPTANVVLYGHDTGE